MKVEQLLSTRGLIKQSPSTKEILSRADELSPNPVKLFYGETYDDKGNPVDSLKYYFFVAHLAESLHQSGRRTDPTILIADSAACRNVAPDQRSYYMHLGKQRVSFVEEVNKIYATGLSIVKMSDYIHTQDFLERRGQIIKQCSEDASLMAAVKKTVPESKIDIESQNGFLYSFDEIATIINLDIKVGPPREDLYDSVAREIARRSKQKEVLSLFLTPTFPLGLGWSYFFANEGIEDHGITAYKAGSKRLHRNRVIVDRSDPDYVKGLINDTFISRNRLLPNPVLDLGIICEMAQRRLQKDDRPFTLAEDFYKGKISEKKLKEKVGDDVNNYILSKFQK